jgi:hypothetical protein
LQSSPHDGQLAHPDRKPLHILATKALGADQILVHYSNGSAAIFEAEELEKLRPVPKQIFATLPDDLVAPAANEPVFTVTATPDRERPLVLGGALA